MKNRCFLLLFGIWLCLVSLYSHAEITPESVLGEYWKDPLFGEAAESQTVQIEVLSDRIWPGLIEVPVAETIRFVFLNRSNRFHLFAFSKDLQTLRQDESFQKFIADELFHAQQKANHDPRSHSHSSSSVDDAEPIVKILEQRPTVFVQPNEKKEILVRFADAGSVALSCVIDAHNEMLLSGRIEVIDNEQ